MARLKEFYKQDVAPALMKKFSYKSVMQIPKLDKIVINVGAGEAKDNAKVIDAIMTDISAITGQKPMVCKARIIVASASIGPVPLCGYPACEPAACRVTWNFTQPAIIGSGPTAICPGA